jgi:hypothetical protein
MQAKSQMVSPLQSVGQAEMSQAVASLSSPQAKNRPAIFMLYIALASCMSQTPTVIIISLRILYHNDFHLKSSALTYYLIACRLV